MMSEDIKIFEDFWKDREKQHTSKNWAISAFHLGMEVQAQKKTNKKLQIGKKPCANCSTFSVKPYFYHFCPTCGRALNH